jgi:HAD superfamily hydrolase (TIGR01457 family)
VSTLAEGYDAFLFDLDGVLYRATEPVDHAADAVARLRAAGKRVSFVTNNSSATPRAVAERLRGVGVDAEPHEVETSALTTATMLADLGVRTTFVVGEEGIRQALADAGIEIADGAPACVDAVVIGLDRRADYESLKTASVLVEAGARLVATNGDVTFPAGGGQQWPGAGALLAVVVSTTGATPTVVGKPHPPILRAALERAGGGTPLVIGDRLDTDIEGAAGVEWDSLLVLTGISTAQEAERADPAPTFVGSDLRRLFDSV